MLSAHGSAPEVVDAARAEGRYVVNAVCPLVTKVHHEAKVRARKGFTVLYVGHAGHDEAVGTLAVAPDAIRLVERADDLDRALADLGDRPQIAMLAQTTLAHGEWTGLLDEAQSRAGDVWTASRNDLCFATTNRQGALTAIARARRRRRGDRQRQLVEHARAREGRARDAGCPVVLRVDGPDELDLDQLGGAAVVGVTAGASAPEELVDAVIAALAPHARRRARARHRRRRVLPAPARAARARARARRARRARVRRRSRRPRRHSAAASPATAPSDASEMLASLDG